jgi:hypothetical protein
MKCVARGVLIKAYNSGVLMQTFKEAIPYIRDVWTAVGPLLGVLVGALLARSWDKKKWMNDNRKEEFRELITALTEAATAIMGNHHHIRDHTQTTEEGDKALGKYMNALNIIKSRIFVAKNVNEMNLFDRWGEGFKTITTTGSIIQFEDVFEKIRDELIERATREAVDSEFGGLTTNYEITVHRLCTRKLTWADLRTPVS